MRIDASPHTAAACAYDTQQMPTDSSSADSMSHRAVPWPHPQPWLLLPPEGGGEGNGGEGDGGEAAPPAMAAEAVAAAAVAATADPPPPP